MRKHAYLIMAHDAPDLLIMLVKLLDSEFHDIYIHIDKKTDGIDECVIKKAVSRSGIAFVERRDINWGGYSQIETELALLSEAVKYHYSYYHLLSGHDLPLRTADQIYNFFENSGKNYVNFREKSNDIARRIKYYRVFQERRARDKWLWSKLEAVSIKVQDVLHIDRTTSLKDSNIAYGSQWFSITHELACYICRMKDETKKIYRYGRCVDELFVQSLIANSKKDWNLAYPPDNHNFYTCMRQIDWDRGNPYIFQSMDYRELMESNCMFARKFDLKKDKEICSMIFNELLSNERS